MKAPSRTAMTELHGMPRVNSGIKAHRWRIVGRLRTGHALDDPGTEPLRIFREFLLDGVGVKAEITGAGPGRMPMKNPSTEPRRIGQMESFQS